MGAVTGALVGAALGLVFGGFAKGEMASRTLPNEEIRRSLRMTCLVIVGAVTICVASFWLAPKHIWLILWLVLALTIVGALRLGGLTVIQHYAVRLVMWRFKYCPLALISFLDYAAELALLRRAGSGYMFVHRMLLDYFVDRSATRNNGRDSLAHLQAAGKPEEFDRLQ
jgi:hypothetical protein